MMKYPSQEFSNRRSNDKNYHSGRSGEPDRFLMAAEKFKLGVRIDLWVIIHVFAWLAANPEHTARFVHCGITI